MVAGGPTSEQIRWILQRFPTLDAAAAEAERRRPEEFRRLQTQDLATIAYGYERREPVGYWDLVVAVLGAVEQEEDLDARRERWRIPYLPFWYILEQRLKRGKLAKVNSLSEHTRKNPKMPFVGRTRVTELVEWIDEHPEQAQRAYDLHETPAGFRANEDGVLVPRPRNAASQHGTR